MHMVQVAFKMVQKTFTRLKNNPEFSDVVIYFWDNKSCKIIEDDLQWIFEDVWVQTILYPSELIQDWTLQLQKYLLLSFPTRMFKEPVMTLILIFIFSSDFSCFYAF